MLTPEQKIIKTIPVIIKQLKQIIDPNNSFLPARVDISRRRVKEANLQKQMASNCHIAKTTKHKSYGMNHVVTEHKLTFL